MSELMQDIEVNEGFRVENDAQAEWCLKKIREAEEEKGFWKDHFDRQLASICETADATISNMMHYLREYFDSVPHKKTATEENYRLPSGKLVLKQQNPEFQRSDADLLAWLKSNGGERFIKTKESVDWDALKKTLTVIGETAADEDGQIIPCIRVMERDPEFKIGK